MICHPNHAGRRGVFPEKKLIDQAFAETAAVWSDSRGREWPQCGLVLEFAGEFFHDGRFAGAADGEVADGDDLDAQRGVAEDADVVEKAAGFDGDLENFGKRYNMARTSAGHVTRRCSKITSSRKVSIFSVQTRMVSRMQA